MGARRRGELEGAGATGSPTTSRTSSAQPGIVPALPQLAGWATHRQRVVLPPGVSPSSPGDRAPQAAAKAIGQLRPPSASSTGSTRSLTRRLKLSLCILSPDTASCTNRNWCKVKRSRPGRPALRRSGRAQHTDLARRLPPPPRSGRGRRAGPAARPASRPAARATTPPEPRRHRPPPRTPSAPPTSPRSASRAPGRRRSAAGAAPRPATARGRPSDARPLPLSARSSAGCARTCRAEPARPAHVVAERASAARALLRHRRPTARPDSPHEDHGMTPTAGRRVMLDRRDSDGTMSREVSLAADGRSTSAVRPRTRGRKVLRSPRVHRRLILTRSPATAI